MFPPPPKIKVKRMPEGAFRRLFGSQAGFYFGMAGMTLATWYFFSKNAQMSKRHTSYDGMMVNSNGQKPAFTKQDLDQIAKDMLAQNLKEISKEYEMVPIQRPNLAAEEDRRLY